MLIIRVSLFESQAGDCFVLCELCQDGHCLSKTASGKKKSMLVLFAAEARSVKFFLVEKRRLDLTIPGKQFNLVSRSKNWPLSRDYFGSRGRAVVAVAIFKEI